MHNNHTIYEGDSAKKKHGARFSIDEWKDERLDPEFLKRNNLPVANDYFHDANGDYVPRTVFEYIRDHLGYRIELKSAIVPRNAVPGKGFKATVKLVNRGFASPINPRPVYLVLIGKDDVYTMARTETDVRKWYPCEPDDRKILSPLHTLQFETRSFPEVSLGNYKIGIWMPDNRESLRGDARYAIRVANREVPWWVGPKNRYGVNVIGDITVE